MDNTNDGSRHRQWKNLLKILDRAGPFSPADFEPGSDNLKLIEENVKLLVIGAGGLGCELLKNLAYMGFKDIHVIDMDTIELSNLNRQFLFRRKHINQSKAEVAASFINGRFPGIVITPHYAKIQDFDADFYTQFHIIICGLDSIVARRWINGMLLSIISYDEETGNVIQSSLIPLIDGGTEGFKGSARVILPGLTACIDCSIDLYPPQVTYPLCTIANTPRLPEHCIEYVKVIQWSKENPWSVNIDGDDPSHINWIYERATERATQFNIQGVTYRLVQGVVKNIIPAVASTNAVIAAACATETFKLVTSCCPPLNNYMVFNDVDSIYTYTYEAERNPDCLACSKGVKMLTLSDPRKVKLQDVITLLCEKPEYQMHSPAVIAVIEGKNKTLYLSQVRSIEEATRPNLSKTLEELKLNEGAEFMVADTTSPTSLTFRLHYDSIDVEMN